MWEILLLTTRQRLVWQCVHRTHGRIPTIRPRGVSSGVLAIVGARILRESVSKTAHPTVLVTIPPIFVWLSAQMAILPKTQHLPVLRNAPVVVLLTTVHGYVLLHVQSIQPYMLTSPIRGVWSHVQMTTMGMIVRRHAFKAALIPSILPTIQQKDASETVCIRISERLPPRSVSRTAFQACTRIWRHICALPVLPPVEPAKVNFSVSPA